MGLATMTGATIKTNWHALTKEQRDEFNLRAKQAREAVAPAPVQMAGAPAPVMVAKPKRATSNWQLFQKAWNADQKEAGIKYDAIGDRSKACSTAYKAYKDNELGLQAYLQKHQVV